MASGSIDQATRRSLEKALPGNRGAVNEIENILKKSSGKLAGATITVSAEGATVANRRDITIQLTDEDGVALDHAAHVRAIVFTTADATALSNGGSTGIAIGTDGLIAATVVAKKVFDLVSESDGDIDLTYTDTGTDAAFLGLVMPQGNIVMSDELTCA